METAASHSASAALQAALGAQYSLERELGRGGMASVYLARDLRHRRAVAVKVLHAELSALLGPERFLKEIEVTAGLQHPHILPLFDSGSAAGLLYYVMPYVEGETLRTRLERERQLSVDDAVRLAREVADALTYAHGRGVVHRDIKPENVLLQSGHALVADFGIALAVQHAGGERMTQTGLSLGTPQYMAPEQAMGERTIDARADIYALGAVTYEMLAGEPPFTGPTAQVVVARALTEAPRSLTAARPSVPPHVDAAVRTALAKLPADRFASAAAFASALSPTPYEIGPATRVRPRGQLRTAILMMTALAAATALGWAIGSRTGRPAAERKLVRFTIEPDSIAVRFGAPAISPDGRTVVYVANGPGGARLYARRLEDFVVHPLAGTENGDFPFFSHDGEWVGFFSNGAVRKVRLNGGAPVVVATLPFSGTFRGGSWGPDDVVLYAASTRGMLYRVAASGGAPVRVALADTTFSLLHPHLLPGGRTVLVTATRDFTAGRIGILDLASGRLRLLGPGVGARYVAGNIVYAGLDGELYRQPFDLGRLVSTGTAEQIAQGLDAATVTLGYGISSFDASPTGALVYRISAAVRLILADKAGRQLSDIPARVPWAPRFSPDGERVAYGAFGPGRDSSDIWITDLRTGGTRRLTTDGKDNNDPEWRPDGKQIAYSADTTEGKDIRIRALDGSVARSLRRAGAQWPSDWTPDGHALLFTDVPNRTRGLDIWVQPLDGGPARPYVATADREVGGRVSPDGRWVAYMSDETGRNEVYVQTYPTPGGKTLVSAGGGVNPMWGHDSRELYYWHIDQLIAARLTASGGGQLDVGAATPLFRAPYFESVHAMYDVSPDGMRFILVTGGPRTGRLVVALDMLSAEKAP